MAAGLCCQIELTGAHRGFWEQLMRRNPRPLRARAIGLFTILFQVGYQVSVLVPGLVKELDKPHAALNEPAREKAIVGK